jgi:trigger factor
VETSVERLESTSVQLVLNFDQEEMRRAFGKAYGGLSTQVTLPGFRPGKAPRKLLERVLGKEVAQNQVIQDLVPDAITETVEEQDIVVVGEPKLDYEPPEPDQPFQVTATLTVLPEVEVGDVTGLELVKPVVKVSEEDVDELVEALRERAAKSVDVEDRPIEEGDFVYLTYQITADDEALYDEENLPQMYLEVGSEYYEPVVDYDLIGLSMGESKDIQVEYPDDYDNARLAGKPATFSVTIDRISARQKPELDEEFFEEYGVESLEELRDRFRKEREREINESVESLLHDQITAQLMNRCDIELPGQLIASQAAEMDLEFRNRLEREGMDLQEYLSESDTSMREYMQDMQRQAGRVLKRSLVLDAATKEQGIEVTDEDLEETVWTLAQTTNQTFTDMWALLEEGGQLEDMRSRQATEALMKKIMESAEITEKELTMDEFREGAWAEGIPGLDPTLDEPAEEDAEEGTEDSAEHAEPGDDEAEAGGEDTSDEEAPSASEAADESPQASDDETDAEEKQ